MNKMKTYSKMWLIPLLLIMIMSGCDDRVGITSPPVVTTPTVSSTNPANTATSVPFNQKITATFSESMDSLSITTATFTLMQGTSFVSGTVSYTGTTATFAPSSNLAPNTAYTGTITTMAKNVAGTALANNYVWSFTTGAAPVITPPTVSSTYPVNAATGVPFNQKIAATFSVAMDASTITASTFTLMQGTTPISGFVSYSGTTAIFAPSSNLAPNTAYTVTITTGAKDLAGNALAKNYVWSFTTGASPVVTPPTVNSTDPANAATGVPFNQKIAATFSETMDASTITTATFTLMQGTTSVSGFVSYSGTTAIFAPASNLSANTKYTVTITTGAKDLAGNALANNYVWSFTTGAAAVVTPPTVSSTDPANVATGVPFNQKIAATFSKTMDASTITTATFTLMQGTTFVSGTVSYTGTTATYIPSSNLTPNTTYTATITTGAKDLAGNALAKNYVWSFTTGAAPVITPPTVSSTDPANAATSVPLNQKIAATFSKTMDASTITTATFTLMQGTTPISGFVSYSGTTAIFAPASNLAPNTTYTATITTGAKDLAGNALVNNYVWSFTTGPAPVITPPTVTSTDPANAATGVPLNQKVAATFSKTMDASTITTATFTLMQGTTSVSGFVSYSGTTAIFAPASNLLPNTKYTATITTGAKDLADNALVNNYVWSFTTGVSPVVTSPTVISTDPANAATGVALNKQVAATFSEPMDASTITTATFTLMQGTTFVSGTVSYVGTTATYTPSNNLTQNTTYTATITTGAKDLAGNALANNYVWSFTTVIISYTVTLSSNPVAGGTTSGGGTYNSGSSVTVTAAPNAGYTFTNWTEN
ncbi:MAG: Ig-like domain-containing domain, partial [Ignavibacteriaceae bacterium]